MGSGERTIWVWAVAAGLLTLAAVPPEARGQAVSPSDYNVPVSTAQQIRLGATYKYAGSGSNTETNDGEASLLASRFYNSLPFAYDLTFNGVGTTTRTSSDKQHNAYNFVANGGVRKYFSPEGDLFYSLDSRITGNNDYDQPAVEATPGVGYGRFIAVTTLAQAVRIEAFLRQENVITGPLPKQTLIDVAQVIERQSEFETDYGDRYKVHWFQAIESAIAKSGLFAQEGLGAVGTLRVDEVLFQEHVNPRYVGWDARAGVRVELVNPYDGVGRQDPGLSLRARYSMPLGWVSQVDADVQYTSPFTGDFGGNVFTLTGTLNYLYELSNRIDFTASNIVTTVRSDPNAKVGLTEQLRSGFIFFVENQINLNLTGQMAKERGQDITQGVNLALEYRLR